MSKLCLGFGLGFATAAVWLVALGYGAGPQAQGQCEPAALATDVTPSK